MEPWLARKIDQMLLGIWRGCCPIGLHQRAECPLGDRAMTGAPGLAAKRLGRNNQNGFGHTAPPWRYAVCVRSA